MSATKNEPVILDSVTHLTEAHRGAVTYSASHGGIYAAYYAAAKGVGAVILNDAGIGREQAGIAGLELLDQLGVPGAAVDAWTCRIGDGHDGVARGIISTVNEAAAKLGVTIGISCRDALAKLIAAAPPPAPIPKAEQEFRFEVPEASRDGIKVIVMDSISLVKPEDAGQIIVAASHGGILGGRPETAVKVDVYAAIVNDAARGCDDAGISRLPAMDARGIAGACVSAFSCRIGDGRSQWEDGYISAVNATAHRRGGRVGQSTKQFAAAMVTARIKEQR